jgi:hypothetical protein
MESGSSMQTDHFFVDLKFGTQSVNWKSILIVIAKNNPHFIIGG